MHGYHTEMYIYLDWLARHGVDWAGRPHLEFVQHHMPQSLIIDDADVDVGCELLPCDAGVHRLVSIVIVPCSEELFAEVVDGPVFLREPRTCS